MFEDKDKRLKRENIERQIEMFMIRMNSKRFDRYSNPEKIGYFNEAIKLFNELKPLVNLMEQIKFNAAIRLFEAKRNGLIKKVDRSDSSLRGSKK